MWGLIVLSIDAEQFPRHDRVFSEALNTIFNARTDCPSNSFSHYDGGILGDGDSSSGSTIQQSQYSFNNTTSMSNIEWGTVPCW